MKRSLAASADKMDELFHRDTMQPLESRQWSTETLHEGVLQVLHDAEIELPDDLEQLQDRNHETAGVLHMLYSCLAKCSIKSSCLQ